MCDYYLDIETVPLELFDGKQKWSNDPSKSKIISIQFQPLDRMTGKSLGELSILKEWEVGSSEKVIVEQFKRMYYDKGIWNFVPVGNNLVYESIHFEYKFAKYCGLVGVRLYERPNIDTKSDLIMHNKGEFKGYPLAIGKVGLAKNIPEWYDKRNFNAIEEYITKEAERFVEAYHRMKMVLPEIRFD